MNAGMKNCFKKESLVKIKVKSFKAKGHQEPFGRELEGYDLVARLDSYSSFCK